MTLFSRFPQPTTFQQVLIDMQGFILDSSDTIFAVERHRPITEWSLFVASILPSLKARHLDSPEIYFPRIETIADSFGGLYDCSFIFAEWEDGKRMLVWNIYDFSKSVERIGKTQQKSHNQAIRRQRAMA
jgi:hypothetical protein